MQLVSICAGSEEKWVRLAFSSNSLLWRRLDTGAGRDAPKQQQFRHVNNAEGAGVLKRQP
jgi:hypothetical protein